MRPSVMGSGLLAGTRFGIAVLLVFGTLVAAVSAQVGGSISGTVKDPTGGVTPGVTVTAINTVLGTQIVVVTDAQGFYSLPKLPVGRYDLTFQIEGFKPLRRAGVVVDTDAALQVNATLEIGSVITFEASLSFLGFGVQPPTPTWGAMLSEGRNFMVDAWWLALLPGLAITFVIMSGNLFGDWLRDITDPRLRQG